MTDVLEELNQPFLRRLVDVDRIRSQLRALAPPYDLERWRIPLPLWATRPYDDDGPDAWRVLCDDLDTADLARPLCIYIHVPFCASKCPFCDCYSFRLAPRRDDERRRYVERLCAELALWGRQSTLASRPVSTVHLGGGTPTFLGPRLLTELSECCRANFAVSEHTEWALESTVRALTPEMLATMETLGFRRLHLGVQTLQDPVRVAIGRRNSATRVLSCVDEALARGWTVSVDMVCGLPGQTITSFARDIETLATACVDGVSLYELLIYQQNHRWTKQQGLAGRRHLPNYLMFHVAASILERNGYRKNTFNHWAGPRDDNRYFTFPTRDEDCLAVGTIADGVFGDYHFRHRRYAPYLRTTTAEFPGLAGGLRRTSHEQEMHAITTAILSGHIPSTVVADLDAVTGGRSPAEQWISMGLVRQSDDGGLTMLTNGSWLAGNMIHELTGLYPVHTRQG